MLSSCRTWQYQTPCTNTSRPKVWCCSLEYRGGKIQQRLLGPVSELATSYLFSKSKPQPKNLMTERSLEIHLRMQTSTSQNSCDSSWYSCIKLQVQGPIAKRAFHNFHRRHPQWRQFRRTCCRSELCGESWKKMPFAERNLLQNISVFGLFLSEIKRGPGTLRRSQRRRR